MRDIYVSKTVSLKLAQVQWLLEHFGNVSKGVQEVVTQDMNAEDLKNG